MNISTLNELLLHKDEGPRVSIIVSTALKSFSDKEKMELKFKNIADLVARQLKEKYDDKIVDSLILSINSVLKQIDLNHLQQGLGIFVSPNFVRQVFFPFEVFDKVIINRYFEVSDVIETIDKLAGYSVLLLSKNRTRFFKGKGTSLFEIVDQNFPQHFENEYEMERTPSNYMKNNGVEVSQVNDIRLEDYFRKIDKLIGHYMKKEPLVVIGVIKHLSTFKKISKHGNSIIAELAGNYDKSSSHLISELVWPKVEVFSKKEKTLHTSHF